MEMDYLQGESSLSVGIRSSSTLAELWDTDHWVLPPARSEKQVQIYSCLSSLQITPYADAMVWSPEASPESVYSTRKTLGSLMYLDLSSTSNSL
ncbi:hypothetical protein HID58_005624 [Brassica napus]|uniref:Anaphase-promoting complex subunit 1 n=1 Tax=Brassica napus TaxID=3708 RepID=A0ABQ8E9Q5_BRANA|nr:hypothetical protein HID58_005624 [Brassica napus]